MSPEAYDPLEFYFTVTVCGIAVFWALAGVIMAYIFTQRGKSNPRAVLNWLFVGAALTGVTLLALTYKVISPMMAARRVPPSEVKAVLPEYDYTQLHPLAVQHDGREKPLQSGAGELVRHITGRTKFEGADPVAVVLAWYLTNGNGGGGNCTNWETYPFILCDYHDLRQVIFADKLGKDVELTEEQKHGKYVTPADVRNSPNVQQLIREVAALHEKWRDKYSQHLSPLQRKAEETWNRLRAYERVSQNRLVEPLAQEVAPEFVEATLLAYDPGVGMAAAVKSHLWAADLARENRRARGGNSPLTSLLQEDPLHVVAIDKEARSAWLSIGELRAILQDNTLWNDLLKERLSRTPQRYIAPERQQALAEFQKQIQDGTVQKTLDELAELLPRQSEQQVQAFRQRYAGRDRADQRELSQDELVLGISAAERTKLINRISALHEDKDEGGPVRLYVPVLANILREILDARDQELIEQITNQVRNAQAAGYHPDDPTWRMLHLNYLEGRFPNVYRELIVWQPLPEQRVREVLASHDRLVRAYRAGDPEGFSQAAQNYRETLERVSDLTTAEGLKDHLPNNAEVQSAYGQMVGAANAKKMDQFNEATDKLFQAAAVAGRPVEPYPGAKTIDLEMKFNRVQPFMYAWILMLGALAFFVISMMWDSKIPYTLAFLCYLASLGFQVFGYYCRVSISGRAPVTNMYETVIFVASMSAVFALVLELVYRRRVIGLAGAFVATLALVLADQMSMVLDPKISPLTPVLRSNFWLIIHVLTIVSSYAGGTLAWGLGNIALLMITFGKPSRETLKTLSNYTYRAMQIAVLLLAAGTFLGGWWAAYSWGRFWGWDPKEVWALIALVSYVIPLHMRFIGWVKDFGLAVSAVICYSAIVMAWYGVNFVLGAGLHSYGFGGGGPWWVFWAGLINLMWVLVACVIHTWRQLPATPLGVEIEETVAAGA
jgi:ABC-type transport system involved in cytochrome c biogenesis permease subunit